MPEWRSGRIVEWHKLSEGLATFDLAPVDGATFPSYEPGQNIALRRDGCLLTRKVKEDEQVRFVPDLDSDGNQKRGPIAHSYSIASAPFETEQANHLGFYVVLERPPEAPAGRFTESLCRIERDGDDKLDYVGRIVGDFTLAKRAAGFEHVLMVATGTGLAPFVSMIKQLAFEARRDGGTLTKYTLLTANRTYPELGYHRELRDIEASNTIDLLYLPSVSRPSARDHEDPRMGVGRANNLLRRVFGFPPLEPNAVVPELPRERPIAMLRNRIDPARTAVLTCGNPAGMSDIEWIAGKTGMRFEKEEW